MLFNSYCFIFIFFPIVAGSYYLVGPLRQRWLSLLLLVAASLFYYGWWNPVYLWVIAGSIIFNYTIGYWLTGLKERSFKYPLLVLGVIANLALLGYFKYSNFFIGSLNSALSTTYTLTHIALPLAISFFTFQQITYLVDAFHGITSEHSFLHYCVFVTFFPQLIAGPIVHHSEMLPQFGDEATYRFSNRELAIGTTIFFIGLFKKVVLADSISVYATPIFDAAVNGVVLSFFESWAGALAFTFQLYFDFSGYTDMAIGCALILGIHLPINFSSPYKANNIIEFWQCWHMTLSRFLKEYLYIPLGGNRKGVCRRYLNLFITMFLGGLWHGAAWTFVLWGAMHGIYLSLNHLWRAVTHGKVCNSPVLRVVNLVFYRLLTFVAVVVAWVIFRSESLEGAVAMYSGMIGLHGYVLPPVNLEVLGFLKVLPELLMNAGVEFRPMPLFDRTLLVKLFVLWGIVWFAPNTQQILGTYFPSKNVYKDEKRFMNCLSIWKPGPVYVFVFAFIAFYALVSMTNVSEFLYYQF